MAEQLLLIGCGGIGQAIKTAAESAGHHVTLVSHDRNKVETEAQTVDLSQVDQAATLIPILETSQPTWIINTIGMLMQGDQGPEKNIQQLNQGWLDQNVNVNVWPAVQIAQALSKVKKRSEAFKFMTFSARVSSITDNQLGGWYSYRMSKCMLNMFVKTLSIEWKRQLPKAAVYGYHPGTVDTGLSRPFHNNVPADKLFTPQQAADYCLDVLDNLTVSNTGNLFDWQGKRIDW